MGVSSSAFTVSSWYFGFRVITATPWVVRVVLGASRAVWKISARGSVEYTASSQSVSSLRIQARGALSE